MAGIYGIPETFTETPEPPLEDTTPEEESPTPTAEHNRRPTHAVIEDRDDRVYDFVRSRKGVSRSEIARTLGLTPHQAYLSLNRLGTGKVFTKRVDKVYLWFPVKTRGT